MTRREMTHLIAGTAAAPALGPDMRHWIVPKTLSIMPPTILGRPVVISTAMVDQMTIAFGQLGESAIRSARVIESVNVAARRVSSVSNPLPSAPPDPNA